MGSARRFRGTGLTFLALVGVVVLTGCANASSLRGHHTVTSTRARPVGQDGPAAPQAQVEVVLHWAAALQRGDLPAAAAFFHLPSLFSDGPTDTVRIRNRAEAAFVNSTLTCGARVISAFRTSHHLIDVLFRLTARAGRGGGKAACGSGIGLTARTQFLIRHGEIFAWLRAPSLPGDPGGPKGVPTTPTTPGGTSTSQGGTTTGEQIIERVPHRHAPAV